MPIDVERDDRTKRITATGRGTFSPDEVITVLRDLRETNAWDYAVVLDLRFMTGEPAIRDLTSILQISQDQRGGSQDTRGLLAIVATNPALYGMACAYAALAKPPGRVSVFRDRPEAELWIASRTGG